MEPIVRNDNDDPTFKLYGQTDSSFRESATKDIDRIGELIIYKENIYTKQFSIDHPELNAQLEFLNSENYYVLHRDELLAIKSQRMQVLNRQKLAISIGLIIYVLLLIYMFFFWR